MRKTNTYISNDCTKKCLVYVDKNGHYHVKYLVLFGDKMIDGVGGRDTFKKLESAERAGNKWIK